MRNYCFWYSALFALYYISIIVYAQPLERWFNQALQKQQSGNIQDASQLYYAIVQKYPTCTPALYNYAHTLKDLGDMQNAIEVYQKVITHEPNNNFAHFGMGQCYGALGLFEKAFALMEYRSTAIKDFKQDIHYIKTLYTQGTCLKDIIILLRAEWGFGDIIQYIRYAQLLRDRGATIIVQSYPELEPLLRLCPFINQVIPAGDAFPAHTLQIPMLSLPYVCTITEKECTPAMPYIYAPENLVQKWKSYLASYKTFTIGICWQGKGDVHAPPLLNKNIPLHTLAPLIELPGITVFSLQKVDTITPPLPGLITFDATFDQTHGRFMDTAALMQNLDLVITIDTSIAHLAGALNRPVWMLAPYRTDWRWGLRETTSVFYPSMKIFRQESPGDWQGVIKRVIENIRPII